MNILRNLFLWRVARPLVGKAIDLGLGMSSKSVGESHRGSFFTCSC